MATPSQQLRSAIDALNAAAIGANAVELELAAAKVRIAELEAAAKPLPRTRIEATPAQMAKGAFALHARTGSTYERLTIGKTHDALLVRGADDVTFRDVLVEVQPVAFSLYLGTSTGRPDGQGNDNVLIDGFRSDKGSATESVVRWQGSTGTIRNMHLSGMGKNGMARFHTGRVTIHDSTYQCDTTWDDKGHENTAGALSFGPLTDGDGGADPRKYPYGTMGRAAMLQQSMEADVFNTHVIGRLAIHAGTRLNWTGGSITRQPDARNLAAIDAADFGGYPNTLHYTNSRWHGDRKLFPTSAATAAQIASDDAARRPMAVVAFTGVDFIGWPTLAEALGSTLKHVTLTGCKVNGKAVPDQKAA